MEGAHSQRDISDGTWEMPRPRLKGRLGRRACETAPDGIGRAVPHLTADVSLGFARSSI
jgi:hypothetical protein